MKEITTGIKGEALTLVNTTNTAIAAESGSLPVFGSPFMIALMEKATCEAVAEFLEQNETTVGTSMSVTHSRASAIGSVVTAYATLTDIDRKKLTFDVFAKDDKGNTIGSGTIERFVVDAKIFLGKVEGK